MADARFSIGIDLGTTNSAMAYVRLAGDGRSDVFPVAQWDTPTSLEERPTLPSFLYLPEEALAARMRGAQPAVAGAATEAAAWIVGLLPWHRALDMPGRVVHSAKSWLAHHGADREAAFLPWGSEDLGPDEKISPVHASALILAHLRRAWDDRFAATGPDFAFDAQVITITVPASFDPVAQRLTLAAAAAAGYPASVRLLEEPQAAFYHWLGAHDSKADLAAHLPDSAAPVHHVLVVDVGGGTSDFSLFELRPAEAGREPRIKRLAVSDHILLGGDNVDLALAHRIEPRLIHGDERLTGSSWQFLVARCRELKERALAGEGPADETFTVAIPGRGSSLLAGAQSGALTRAEVEEVLLDGFFPECKADARPKRAATALKEWGLPYAADSAVTRHLAAFLKDRPSVSAVLFNGGSLYPEVLRERICRAIGVWQGGPPPLALTNDAPELAVAHGAARYGKLVAERAARIEAGSARAVFLETHGTGDKAGGKAEPALVCILPRGAEPEETFEIADLDLALRINRPVRFQTYISTRHGKSRSGDVMPFGSSDLVPLPPLQTTARVEKKGAGDGGSTVPVTLSAKLSELGLLQVACVSRDAAVSQTWPLDFDLRPQEHHAAGVPDTAVQAPTDPGVSSQALQSANGRLTEIFAQAPGPRSKLTAARVLQSLEKVLGEGKAAWNGVLVRALWPALEGCAEQRRQSPDHEEAWLSLAGFLLRPGFGAPLDEDRIDRLWSILGHGTFAANKRIRLQEYILWRRLAGGLDRERQETLLAPEMTKLLAPKPPPPELIRLAGALERVAIEAKTALVERFITVVVELARQGGHCTPYLAALGLLLNRAPLYAGPETVVPPKLVAATYEALGRLDWSASDQAEVQTLFLRAARVVNDRALDVEPALRNRIASRLEKLGATAQRTAKIRAYMPLAASERLGLFGESLPPGLILAEP